MIPDAPSQMQSRERYDPPSPKFLPLGERRTRVTCVPSSSPPGSSRDALAPPAHRPGPDYLI